MGGRAEELRGEVAIVKRRTSDAMDTLFHGLEALSRPAKGTCVSANDEDIGNWSDNGRRPYSVHEKWCC